MLPLCVLFLSRASSQVTTFVPKVAHTIVLFTRPFGSSIVAELIHPDTSIYRALSGSGQIFGVNFGVNLSFSLRVLYPFGEAAPFRVFEPSFTPDTYVVSTLPQDDFVVSSPQFCARADVAGDATGTFGFVFLQSGRYKVTVVRRGLAPGDSVRYRIGSGDPSAAVPAAEFPEAQGSSDWSEWSVSLAQPGAPRALSLGFLTDRRARQKYPPFRQAFARDATIGVLERPAILSPPEDPRCAETTAARPPPVARAWYQEQWRDDWMRGVPPRQRHPVAKQARPIGEQPKPPGEAGQAPAEQAPPGGEKPIGEQPKPPGEAGQAPPEPPKAPGEAQPIGEQPKPPGEVGPAPAEPAKPALPASETRPQTATLIPSQSPSETEEPVEIPLDIVQGRRPRHAKAKSAHWVLGAIVVILVLSLVVMVGLRSTRAPPLDEARLLEGAIRRGVAAGPTGTDTYGVPLVLDARSQFMPVTTQGVP
jgi:hypothetical protein